MRFSFKKIGSVLASTVMLSSTIALAAAANFPAPFLNNGGDVAIVHGGANAAYTDLVAVADISSYLSTQLAQKAGGGGGANTGTSTSVTGEGTPLFTSGTKLYIDDPLNTVKASLTKSDLPTVLAKGTFSGDVDATYEQTIELGADPINITFAKQPTSSDMPQYGIGLSTNSNQYLYNATVTFSKSVNFTSADTKGQDLKLFGHRFIIGSGTDSTQLILLKEAQKFTLTNDDPSSQVTIGGKTYTVELVSASSNSATIKVTDSDGKSDSKEVKEAASKKIQGLTVAVDTADANNFKLSATIIAGAEKITFPAAGGNVKKGDNDAVIDGTLVTFSSTSLFSGTTKLTISVYGADSDHKGIISGKEFIDPVFGSFKTSLSSMSSDENSSDRETISVVNSGDDKMQVTFKAKYATDSKAVTWAKNLSNVMALAYDDDDHNITVREMAQILRNGYAVVGNEESGHLIRASTISNSVSYTNSKVEFTDVLSGDTYAATLTADSTGTYSNGTGTVNIGGKSYTVTYNGTTSSDTNWVRLNYPDSTPSTGSVVLYPTVQTDKGAKLAFYKPLTITLTNWDGSNNNVTQIRLPNGNGYTNVAVAGGLGDNATIATTNLNLSGTGLNYSAAGTIGSPGSSASLSQTVSGLTFNFTGAGTLGINGAGGERGGLNMTVYLVAPDGGNIVDPALILWEEKDDNSAYNAVVITLQQAGTQTGGSNNGIGVADVKRSFGGDTKWDAISVPGKSTLTREADLWGIIASRDTGDSNHAKATITYPDNQVYANAYVSEDKAEITSTKAQQGGGGSTGGGTLGSVAVTDAEASSVAGKNLIVVGGSCVNTVAAQLLGVSSHTCGADFTAKTGIGAGQFLIETFARTGDKVATLVAGYNAGDTTNAAKYLTTQAVDTMANKKYKGTSATSAELMTETPKA